MLIIACVMCTKVSALSSDLVSTPKYTYLLIELFIFQIHHCIHPITMGDKLVHYYSYHEEAQITLNVCTHLFKRVFSYFYTNTIFRQLILSSQKHIMIQRFDLYSHFKYVIWLIALQSIY